MVAIIYINDTAESGLRAYYGYHIIAIPVGMVAMLVAWLKVHHIVKLIRLSIANHEASLKKDPSAIFTGFHFGKWKKRVIVFGTILNGITKAVFLILTIEYLYKATVRYMKSTTSRTDSELLGLFVLVFVGSVFCVCSVFHALYTILLLARLLPFEKRWYPLEINDNFAGVKSKVMLL